MARPRAWGDTLLNNIETATGATRQVNLLTSLTPSDTITAMRLLIRLRFTPQNYSDNIIGLTHMDLGIGVASEEAFAAGAASLPDITDDSSSPPRGWLWRTRLVIAQQDPSTDLFSNFMR